MTSDSRSLSIALVNAPAKGVSRAPADVGNDTALLDEAEARRRLIAAACACIVPHGSARIRMSEVADEAGVARSTLYRYFRTREELIIGLFLSKIDPALALVISRLPDPDNAARSLPDLVPMPLGFRRRQPGQRSAVLR
jgi:TetR/AcrR family transcriptional regulator